VIVQLNESSSDRNRFGHAFQDVAKENPEDSCVHLAIILSDSEGGTGPPGFHPLMEDSDIKPPSLTAVVYFP
jgi:hypothetical protein